MWSAQVFSAGGETDYVNSSRRSLLANVYNTVSRSSQQSTHTHISNMVDADQPVSSSQCLRLICKVLTEPDPSTENNQSPRAHLCSDCGHDTSGRNLPSVCVSGTVCSSALLVKQRTELWLSQTTNLQAVSAQHRIKCCIACHHSACWALLYLHRVSHYILYYLCFNSAATNPESTSFTFRRRCGEAAVGQILFPSQALWPWERRIRQSLFKRLYV